jgi:hypothetical protein
MSLAPIQGSVPWQVLHLDCARKLGQAIGDEDFKAALNALNLSGDVRWDENRVSRTEPDFAEGELENAIEIYLDGTWLREKLRLEPSNTVFHRTARGGTRDTGLFSRPDFTIATIRRLKYDPLRHLDVITFELKNLAGATLMAVHEALAHTRFAHYSFLVCPRSRLIASNASELRDACARHGIGLIMFEFVNATRPPKIKNVELELYPLRKSPDPYDVEAFVDDRLPDNAKQTLAALANL